ncbi:MAG: tetratricopeptide repeat protein [Planctomycetes bacterium]|nr:tetratricopeptide repeat protein [Planctomycetota bacterium]
MSDSTETLLAQPLEATDWNRAAQVLEQAVKAGYQDSNAAYLLAMCYKHLGRNADARHVLSKIAQPDANVHLQRGILAFAERDFAAAVEDFSRSLEQEPRSYPAAYNLLLTRLSLGEREACAELIPKIVGLCPAPEEKRFLEILRTLLDGIAGESSPDGNGQDQHYLVGTLTAAEEARLVDLLGGLGQFDVAYPLLARLVAQRPHSVVAHAAYFGAALVEGKHLMDRFQWEEAYSLLAGVARKIEGAGNKLEATSLICLNNMLGVCSSLMQDFERAAWYFRSAQDVFVKDVQAAAGLGNPRHVNERGVYMGAMIEQNLALTAEWQGRFDRAEQHWNRYFDYLEHYFPISRPPEFLPRLAFEGLSRLADVFTRKEKWTSALGFLQRAHRIRPSDSDTLERLFHMYTQLKKTDEARRALKRLREIRPNDPQVELFELDVRDLRNPEDVERMLGDMRRVLQRFPGDMRVEERTTSMINNVIPTLERQGEQYTTQINKVIDQMRRLPSYQINWPVVRNVMRDLEEKFFQLRRVAQKCLSLVSADDLRRDLNSLIHHCDRKIDQCHSLGE